MDLGLSGRKALVTGSFRGTGAAIARRLAAEGARVRVHGFDAGPTAAVAASIREAGSDAEPVVGDLSSDEGVAEIAAAAGDVDVLVASYGTADGGDWQSPSAAWLEAYQKNVLSAVRVIHAFLPGMRARGFGRIVLLGTIGTTRPAARMPHYYAAKASLPALTLSLAKEVAGSGVTVNLVSPGILATEEVRKSLTERAHRKGRSTAWADVEREAAGSFLPNLVGRIGRPEEVADVVAFLASERAAFVTGANWRIDGGATDAVV
ncbi:MAG: SDR family oxidoreductase [Myxococcales bacterium]|nr:SDR family oxidoreductase [Myxococcales bacterium]